MGKTITIDVRMIHHSGIGTYIRNIVPYVLESPFVVRLLGDPEEIKRLGWDSFPGVSVLPTTEPIYSIGEQLRIPGRISSSSDLLWVPHFNIPIAYKGRLLVTVHDAFHLAMPQLLEGHLKKMYSRFLFKRVGKKADRVITVSNFSKQELHQHLGEDMNVSTIYNGVAKDWFASEFAEVNEKKPYIVYVGNVKPHKNLRVLLNAFSRVVDQIPHNLVIVGKKEGFVSGDNQFLEQSEALGERISFTGYVSDEVLKSYIHHAEVLVFPSLYEGFGLPPLEAMACGTPVLVSTAASIPEVCEEGAVYFNPHDDRELSERLVMLLQDESMKREMVKRGKEQVQQFTWSRSAKEHLRIIEELIAT
ncbi:glycosyltransferase family 4 protein [Alkalicoccobacillus murimartini]|uniref:Glycosyltransferase involved in cell wall biosynthesis n=1 Tax=Alkalicoccobacillus murimartini TaxID=171685 RepID=A0ABT9YI87_9BACI|nr:glycosyltransferase family 1 protein [Alkalicoccobacillus murimartini]MDQ0206922.1 glycosyltransferase involved in cell wall biosynthesis [Alkalicoccobacillus murimartini]